MSLVVVGAVVLVLCAMAYALNVGRGLEGIVEDSRAFQARKDRYRWRRDDFMNDPQLMEELKQWKEENNGFDYEKL